MRTLEDLGTGIGWVAEHDSEHLGMGQNPSGSFTPVGFCDPRLLVFESKEDAQAFLDSWELTTFHPVCHSWHDG